MSVTKGDLSIAEVGEVVSSVAAGHPYILRVSLFGSRARGDNRPDSDYDFCILTSDRASIFSVEAFREDLVDALGHEVDFAYEGYMSERFLKHAAGDMRVVYER